VTGTPLLIGQILTALLFIGVGLGLVLWLFRADGPPAPSRPAEPPPADPPKPVRLRPPGTAGPPEAG